MALIGNRTRKSYSFKSAGNSISSVEDVVVIKNPPPIGIKTPLQINLGRGLFEMNTDIGKQISDNLRNLILTNWGERLGFYDFGANIRPIVFDLGQDEADQIAIQRIKATVKKYMPFVLLANFQVFVDREDNEEVAKVGIQVTYKIPQLDNYTRSLEIMLYVGG
tara:strand:- start:585 stop:1076 length:492 start_codon:yes stop_codon:yes gene_type:complete